MEKIVYLSIGANQGHKLKTISEALNLIAKEIGSIQSISNFYESAPLGFESKNQFLNICISVSTNLSPTNLLLKTQIIEQQLGRKKKGPNYEDRTIDLDIIYYENWIINLPELTVPHPLLSNRKFVLLPLNDIAPLFLHPRLNLNTKELIRQSNDKSSLKRIDYKYIGNENKI